LSVDQYEAMVDSGVFTERETMEEVGFPPLQQLLEYIAPVISARSREFRSGCGMPDRGDAAFHLATIDLAD
jgi:hypothetical protein